jgi:hypothetical protein
MAQKGWCLVLAIWGDRYADAYVNQLARAARDLSADCTVVVVFTDRDRPGIEPSIRQERFPAFFDRPEFYRGGYVVKLSVFSRTGLPPDTVCVYLDLDSVVTGDLGRIAALVRGPNDCLMLPPGNLIGFGALRRVIYRLTGGQRFAIGNSSVMAYSSAAEPNLCDTYQRLYGSDLRTARHMHVDDRFISWFAQPRLRAVPPDLAVMFRREFLSRGRLTGWLKGNLPGRSRRLGTIAAITFNGADYKPESLLALKEGAVIHDKRGRTGIWSRERLGPVYDKIITFCQAVVRR